MAVRRWRDRRRDASEPTVRSWTASCASGGGGGGVGGVRFYLELAGTRYCNNVARAHRSNGVRYTVDVASGAVWQSCWDADTCAGYRLPLLPLPPAALAEARAVESTVERHGNFTMISINEVHVWLTNAGYALHDRDINMRNEG